MGADLGRFYLFRADDGRRVLVFEPLPKKYVWLEMWIPPDARRNGHAARMVEVVLEALPGAHHIHFPEEIKTFSQIASTRGWRRRGESEWFQECIAFETKSRALRKQLPQLEFEVSQHRRCPLVDSFYSRDELRKCISRIRADLGDA